MSDLRSLPIHQLQISALRDRFDAMVLNLTQIARAHGFLLGLYGSVLTGQGTGQDIDIMLNPWRPDYNVDSCLLAICKQTGARQVRPIYRGMMGTEAYTLMLPDHVVLDIRVQHAVRTPAGAGHFQFVL